MVRLTELNHQILQEHIHPGDVVIDATCGNGHDTLFLSQCVGDAGQVIACDLQKRAIEVTRQRCAKQDNIQFLIGDHAVTLATLLKDHSDSVAAILFNLGYLPNGDKTRTTKIESTESALVTSLDLLRSGGLLSVLAYVGHPGGESEELAVRKQFDIWTEAGAMQMIHQPAPDIATKSPRLYIGAKRLG